MNKAQQQYPQDDFGSFLSSVNKAMKENKGVSQTSIRIVRYLSHTHEARVETVLVNVRSSFKEFNSGLEELKEAGLIKMDDDEDEGGVIHLTDEGMRWAQTMKFEDDDEGDH
jgi:predicted transcriptional regulator